MLSLHVIVLLLVILVGLLFGLIVWGFWRVQQGKFSQTLTEVDKNSLQIWLLALAVFTLGVFVTFVLLILFPGGT